MRPDARRPGFWRAAAVSAGTGAAFMAVYHACNAYAAACGRVRQWYWDWELAIPVVPWLIVPYWSIDLLFAITPFLCTTRSELRVFAGRVLLATALAAACFLAWPLGLAHVRDANQGVFAPLFAAIHGFDKPHNLFPSLHVAFAVILRWTWHRHLAPLPRWIFHAWFAAISVSTVLVHQHHLVDVAGGLVLAVLCCYLIAEEPLPAARPRPGRWTWLLSAIFASAAGACLLTAWRLGSWAWILAWPALAFGILALAHAGAGGAVFRKREGGLAWSARLVLAPYLLGLAWSRRRWWRRDATGAAEIADGVWVGRLPDAAMAERLGLRGVVDLCAEHDGLAEREGLTIRRLPWLDLAEPTPASLGAAAKAIEELRSMGPVLVHCGLGYGRSASAVAAWLLLSGRATDAEAAADRVRAARPGAHIDPGLLADLAPGPAGGAH